MVLKKVDNAVILSQEEYQALCKMAEKESDKSKKTPRISTSKLILIVVWSITIILVAICIGAFLWTDKDISGLVALAGVVTACAAGDTAMYSWKAKVENKLKISMSMIKDLAKEYGIESVISLAGMVLSE